MAESISIEETNALREKLGLPPLAAEGTSEDEAVDPERDAYENYQKLQQEKQKAKKDEEIRKKIEKSQNRKRNLAKLQGKGLGEASDEEDDSALNWIKKSRKREKDLAARRARELEEMVTTYQSYDADDLSGLKVSHAMSEFQEGGETILTLKDRNILGKDDDEEDDELTNVTLEDRQRLKKNLDAKKKKPGYNPYDDDQFNGKKQSILPDYEQDEEEESGFVIGKSGVVKPAQAEMEEQSVSEKLKEQTLSYQKMQEIKDYYTQEEADAMFKKPKSKKKKKMRRKAKEDEEEIPVVPTEPTPVAPRQRTLDPDANFVDDDDLQEALARTRRIANKQKSKQLKKMTPEEIAKQLRAEAEVKLEQVDEDEGGLVLSETTEFVNSLGTNMLNFTSQDKPKPTQQQPQQQRETTEELDVPIKTEPEYEVHDVDAVDRKVKLEEIEEGEDVPMEEVRVKEEPKEEVIVEEPLVSRGLAATLSLLNQKGIIAKPTEEQIKRDKIAAEQIRWQNEQRKKEHLRALEEQREKERRRRGRGREQNSDRMRELEREREREREREEEKRMREYIQAMENYKPEVNLEYTDDSGRVMKTAEAFRYMSHKFHGKTSGKTKTEKRMQKIEEERRLNMMSSTDTPHNLAHALLERQQRTGNAHVVLSVGNRGVVPSSAPIAGSSTTKPSNKK
ncbi:SART-1 protein [Choanephora cucurbitarum]|nr:SART-1 protein [Choanephora cucurbitarum]